MKPAIFHSRLKKIADDAEKEYSAKQKEVPIIIVLTLCYQFELIVL